MDVVLDIEGRHQNEVRRCRIPPEGLVIGRGFDCDVILRDPRADARHVRLTQTEAGTLVLTDLHSVNGTRVEHRPLAGEAATLASGASIQIGKTQLRVFLPDHAVAPARSPSVAEQLMEATSRPLLATLITLAALGIYVGFDYLEVTTEYRVQQAVNQALEFGIGGALWMFFWGLISKLVRGESHLLAHWCLGVIFLALAPVADDLVGIAAFNLQRVTAFRAADALATLVLSTGALVIALAFATHLSRRARWLLALAPAAIVLGINNLLPLLADQDENVRVPQSVNISLPPAFRLAPAVSLDHYLESTDTLFQVTRELAEAAEAEAQAARAAGDEGEPPATTLAPATGQ